MRYEKLWEESVPANQRHLAQDPPPIDFFENSPELLVPKRFSQVRPNLFRGGIIHPEQIVKLTECSINLIVSLVPWYNLSQYSQADAFEGTQIHAPCVFRRDLTPERIRIIAGKIGEHLRDSTKNKAYVHCLKGQVRTGMVIGGYKILEEGKNDLAVCGESFTSFGLNFSSYKTLLNL